MGEPTVYAGKTRVPPGWVWSTWRCRGEGRKEMGGGKETQGPLQEEGKVSWAR